MKKKQLILIGVIAFLVSLGSSLRNFEDPIEQVALFSIYLSAVLIPIYTVFVSQSMVRGLKILIRLSSFVVFYDVITFIGLPKNMLFATIICISVLAYLGIIIYFGINSKRTHWNWRTGSWLIPFIAASQVLLFVNRVWEFMRISLFDLPLIHLSLFLLSVLFLVINRNKESDNLKILSAIMLPSMFFTMLILFVLLFRN